MVANSWAPPKPIASIMNTAAMSGEPRIVAIAANAPETPTSAFALGSALRSSGATNSSAAPLPRASRIASGPMTAPRHRLARPASRIPGRWAGCVGPAWMPDAGM